MLIKLVSTMCDSLLLNIVFTSTVIPWYTSASELVKPCTSHILTRKKNVSALACQSAPLSHDETEVYMSVSQWLADSLVLVGFDTHHNKLPLYFAFLSWCENLILSRGRNI